MNLVYCDESSLGILSPGGHGLYKLFEPGWAQAKDLLKKVKHIRYTEPEQALHEYFA